MRLGGFEQVLIRLLERLLPEQEREFLLGDLMEELHRRRATDGPWATRRRALHEILALARHGWLWRLRRPKEDPMSSPLESAASQSPLSKHLRIFGRDLRVGARRLVRAPGPTLVIVATLALGIGLNSLVFMLADTLLFRPLPYPEAERLISIETNNGGSDWYGSSEPELFDLEELEVLEAVGAWSGGFTPLERPGASRRLQTASINAHLLSALGVPPSLGRLPAPEEHAPGGEAVVVISHGFWLRELGGRPEALGETLRLGGTARRIVGVMPRTFRFPDPQTEAWMPLQLDRQDPFGRNNHYLSVVARVRAGASLDEAETAVATLAARSTSAYPEFYGTDGYHTRVRVLRQAVTGGEKAPMLVMLGAVGLLLLLTCANVANVQLGRGAARARSLAVQRSLGASRGHLVGEFMAESSLLAGAGAVLALGLAFAAEALLPAYLPQELLRLGEPRVDFRLFFFTLFVALLTTLAFGLWPAFRTTQPSWASAGNDISAAALSRSGGRSRTLRSALVAGQMALAVILLIGCGLVGRSLQRLADLDPGFDSEGVVVIEALPDREVLDSPTKIVDHYRGVETLLSASPGVTAAGALNRLPMAGTGNIWSIEIEGRPATRISDAPYAQVQQATPGAFRALEIPLLEGRLLEPGDTADAPAVVVVNQAFAREFWPGESPLGRRFRVYQEDAPWMTIVGVVETIRDGRLDREGLSQWYVPHAQAFETAYVSPRSMALLVRVAPGAGDPSSLAPGFLSALKELDDRILYLEPTTLASRVSTSLAFPRQIALWLAIFAGVAMVLASLGLYGVLSYLVAVRRPEIGVRMALGAAPRDILARILGEGFRLCFLGLAAGLASGIVLSQGVESLFYEAQVLDPVMLGAIVLLLAVVGGLAPLAPAWRASRTDPTKVLRGS